MPTEARKHSFGQLTEEARQLHKDIHSLLHDLEHRNLDLGNESYRERFKHALERKRKLLERIRDEQNRHQFLHNLEHQMLKLHEIGAHIVYAHVFEPRLQAAEISRLQEELEAQLLQLQQLERAHKLQEHAQPAAKQHHHQAELHLHPSAPHPTPYGRSGLHHDDEV